MAPDYLVASEVQRAMGESSVQQGHLGREQGVVTSGKLLPRSRVRRLGSTEIEYKRSLIQCQIPRSILEDRRQQRVYRESPAPRILALGDRGLD